MAWPSVTWPNLLPAAVRQEFEQFAALLQGYLSAQHKDDGSHGDITADSLEVTGNAIIDGELTVGEDGTFGGNVIAQHANGAVTIGATGEAGSPDDNERGIVMDHVGGLSMWSMAAERGQFGTSPAIVWRDLLNLSAANGIMAFLRNSSVGAVPAEYILRPYNSSIDLYLGTDSNGVRWAQVNATRITGIRTASRRGNAGSIATATPTTVFTVPAGDPGQYQVFAWSPNNGAANYTACADVLTEGSTARITANNGANLTITLSGMNIQVTQTSGGNLAVEWTILQIA